MVRGSGGEGHVRVSESSPLESLCSSSGGGGGGGGAMAACGGVSRGRRFLGLLPFLIWAVVVGVASEASASRQRSEVWRHLKRLNKPAVKSIQSPDGDIIDCVHISHQPAFDHPLLKNHTIQMMPSFHPEGLYDQNKVRANSGQRKNTAITQMWHLKGSCPENTIPIRRTKREDILRASSVKTYGRKKHGSIPKPVSASLEMFSEIGHQHAIGYVVGGIYHGAKATMNVWNPRIQQPNEFSLSQIWVLRGAYYVDLNSIEAGWQVSADLYGDNNTRLFTYWTSDAYHTTGCYNLLCSGFIQVNNRIAMGASISPISTYSGSQFDITILVWKDKKEGNWWMQFGDAYVGYWPSFLFSFLGDSASMIQWGGEVVNSELDGQHTSTEMGSGHFPEEGFSKASYFKNIQIVDESNTFRAPEGLQPFTEQSSCYNVQIVDDGGDWGNHFYYGGPGRNENCP